MDKVIDALLAQLRLYMGNTFTYMYGLPGNKVDHSLLPLICVAPDPYEVNSTIIPINRGQRSEEHSVIVRVITSTEQETVYDAGSDTHFLSGLESLIKTVEERDAQKKFLSTTILGSIMKDLTLGGTVGGINSITIPLYRQEQAEESFYVFADVKIKPSFTYFFC